MQYLFLKASLSLPFLGLFPLIVLLIIIDHIFLFVAYVIFFNGFQINFVTGQWLFFFICLWIFFSSVLRHSNITWKQFYPLRANFKLFLKWEKKSFYFRINLVLSLRNILGTSQPNALIMKLPISDYWKHQQFQVL